MLSQQWIDWISLNINRGCNLQEIIYILKKNGFDLKEERDIFDKVESYPKNLKNDIFKKVPLELLDLYFIEDFLDDKECNFIIELMQQNLTQSLLSYPDPDPEFRTSQTSYLEFIDNQFVKFIDSKIANTIGINNDFSEGIQAQLYKVNQQFKPHTDYFTPGTSIYDKHCGLQGNRTWTFMVYLNDVEKGGETSFPKVNKIFYPKKGMAIIWNNLDYRGFGNPYSMHSGNPVEKGYKAIITKWFRQKSKNYFNYN